MDTKSLLRELIWLTVLKNYKFVALLSAPRTPHTTDIVKIVRYNERMTQTKSAYSLDNPYEQICMQALAPYEAFVDNPRPGALSVVATTTETLINPLLRTAIISSAQRFNFSSEDIAWISRETTCAHNINQADEVSPTRSSLTLADKELLTVIEAIDPLALIICDELSVQACSHAYRSPLTLNTSTTLLVRPCACFTDLVFLLTTPVGKQQAWHILKETLGAL